MSITRLEYLFQRYLNRTATAGEDQELMLLIQQSTYDDALKALLNEVWQNLTVDEQLAPDKADAIFNTILSSNPANPIPVIAMNERRPRRSFKRLAVAAAVLVLVATGGWLFYVNRSTPPVATTNDSPANDIAPGKNNAVLILADGRRINLDSIADGELAKEGSVVIRKSEGRVVYDFSKGSKSNLPAAYNTITTARGNQYQLLLPDGSTIWLNAESSVRFPVAFTGNERRVEVTGEIYLAVKHNSKMPFTVVANGVEVQDLGTEFNVNAYEGLVTTVVEGSVKIVKRETANVKGASPVLARGQQAILKAGSGNVQLIKDADVDAAIAWKNGQFMFTGNSIQSVMRQLERWYDIEVTYGPNVSKEEFVGTITRFSNISAVLKMLEKTGTVHFEVHGRKVLVK